LSSKVVFEIDSLDNKVLTNKRKSTQTFYLVCHKDLRAKLEVLQQNNKVSTIHDTSKPVKIIAIVNEKRCIV